MISRCLATCLALSRVVIGLSQVIQERFSVHAKVSNEGFKLVA
jgi:hypothetical protein